VPSGKGFGVDWGKLVHFVGVVIRDSIGCIPDRPDEGDEESRKSRFGVVAEALAATLKWEVGKKECKLWERGVGISGVLKEQVASSLKCIREGGGPGFVPSPQTIPYTIPVPVPWYVW
jgi:hypothetical protein